MACDPSIVVRLKQVGRLLSILCLGPLSVLCVAAAEDPVPLIAPMNTPAPALYSTERLPLSGGSELITIFQNDPNGNTPVPVLSVLRDTLGDDAPENDRVRYVWLLSNVRPGWWQRVAAALPFFYSRAASRTQDGSAPEPILDLAEKNPKVLGDLGEASLQFAVFDPAGLALRASTRAYLGNRDNDQKAGLTQALAVLSAMEDQPGAGRVFSDSELDRLRARLLLGQRRFGGLASEERLPQVSANELREVEEARGRNWEILRQAAESNGLWFDPIALGSREPEYALIWIGRSDLSGVEKHSFDGQFLRIGDPWTDARLRNWKGRVSAGSEGEERIPLALYDLENTRAPLLLVDFRNTFQPKRREIFERGVTDVMKSVFDLSYLHDWYYFATRGTHHWVEGRHGATSSPVERLRGYAKLKLKLGLDDSLDPRLRTELIRQVARLALNPLESGIAGQARIAREHYERLVASSEAIEAKLDRSRSAELAPVLHSRRTRLLFFAGTAATAGLYRHRERIDDAKMALLDTSRRAESAERFLRTASTSSRIEVDFDVRRVRDALATVAGRHMRDRPELLAALFTNTRDEGLRLDCLGALRQEHDPAAGKELVKLARLEAADSHWRSLCLLSAQERQAPAKAPGAWSGSSESALSVLVH